MLTVPPDREISVSESDDLNPYGALILASFLHKTNAVESLSELSDLLPCPQPANSVESATMAEIAVIDFSTWFPFLL